MNVTPRIRRTRALVVGITLSLATFAATVPSSAATVQPYANVHSCKSLGNDGITQAIVCADVIDDSAQGPGWVEIKVEAMCQNLSLTTFYPQCADISLGYGADATNQLVGAVDYTHWCGHTAGPCPTGRLIESFVGQVFDICQKVQTYVLSGARIALPGSGEVKWLSGNFFSAGTTICP